ncbi:DUF418 domain-containing protein [Sinosporangium siamense]|uniref:DUF418 domain-containing protein n=1 Tax=Sinosporangium siamense TaxID=1367973 RepID=A0A919V664_9ACTN|nr:DUF418 domain-containing protein [Sinosporangium siamense]GII92178.1 hypothetical protein Ssi02_24090 [Sinosporangium siamense]
MNPAQDIPQIAVSRIHELDAVRGFALCGITLVNIWQHASGESEFNVPGVDPFVMNVLEGRFYPIFAFLFGISFALFFRSATRRTPQPRLVLLRRFGALAAVGGVHAYFNPGEVLFFYGVAAIVVLVPATFLPGRALPYAGVGALLAGLYFSAGIWLMPGLFLLGMAFAERPPSPRWALPVFVVGAAASALLLLVSWNTWYDIFGDTWYRVTNPVVALLGAVTYALGIFLLVRRVKAVSRLLAPVGRMAFTHYLTATPVFLLLTPVLAADTTRMSVFALAGALIVVFMVYSPWWLRRYHYGPLEWVWRCLTWWEVIPNRRPRTEAP